MVHVEAPEDPVAGPHGSREVLLEAIDHAFPVGPALGKGVDEVRDPAPEVSFAAAGDRPVVVGEDARAETRAQDLRIGLRDAMSAAGAEGWSFR